MAIDGKLVVDAQQVLGKSGEMKTIRSTLNNLMEDLKTKVQSLTSYYEGEASTTFQTKFTSVHKEIDEMLHIVDEYTHDLDEIAQIYTSAEDGAKSRSEGLKPEVFNV